MGNIQVIYGAGFDTANAPHKVKFRESILSLQAPILTLFLRVF